MQKAINLRQKKILTLKIERHLFYPPESLASTLQWELPDCTGDAAVVADAGQVAGSRQNRGGDHGNQG